MARPDELKTFTGPSSIEGTGRFALEWIPAGHEFGIALRKLYDTGDVQKDWRQTEFARYINHSPNPNIGHRREGTGIYLYALKNIPKGTEITTNYNDPEAIPQEIPKSWDQLASRVASRYATNLRQDHFIDEGMVGEHWGTAASGVLVTDGSRVLLLKRSSAVLDPGLWGIPGGAVPVTHQTGRGKDAKKSAFDEAREEMGGIPSGSLAGKYVFRGNGGFTFTTFVWKVAPETLDKFKPRLNWEHTDWMVKDINSVGSSGIHPGVVWVLKKMGPVLGSARYAAPIGDCYDANGQYFMHHALFPGKNKKLRMVHGEVTGQGPLDGVKYGHAWVEDGNTVIDVSNGRTVRMPKSLYYQVGHIKENGNTHVYDPEEFRAKVMQYEHWGPWDLRTSSGL